MLLNNCFVKFHRANGPPYSAVGGFVVSFAIIAGPSIIRGSKRYIFERVFLMSHVCSGNLRASAGIETDIHNIVREIVEIARRFKYTSINKITPYERSVL